jgi:hypothetical protein
MLELIETLILKEKNCTKKFMFNCLSSQVKLKRILICNEDSNIWGGKVNSREAQKFSRLKEVRKHAGL